ncbi:OB-fold nucleic acid binding domain-containing protein [Nocardioides rotundus]|uniref:OB-fold nucleic acid binding domain-containing protein n=1 Tax=Nocardioides rotundus TaxID=1774216 RepID=UPI001CC02213|nr:OB-fold nucleic acid binding domain-containing protein [Nocardioides rotundus]UAL28279.1 OB-fold nucleic acid binding domain-containing protein [Nocardioides rotundus]
MPEKSRLRGALSRWANSAEEHDRALRQEYVEHGGATAIGEAPDREMVVLRGTLRTVTLRPRGGVPALEAELYDGTGAIDLVWLGRRRIAGIAPGASIQVRGRIGRHDRDRVIYNPRYELIP